MTELDVKGASLALLCMQRHSWEQGVTMQAFLELGEAETVIRLAREAAYRRLSDGRLAVMDDTGSVTDPCCTGEALMYAARETGDEQLGEALRGLENWALYGAPRNAAGVVYHVMDAPQFWVDSCYMLPPFLAALGRHAEAMRQLSGYEQALLDTQTGLFAHQWDDGEKRMIRAAHWGVGNGWALAAYARLIDLMPEHARRLCTSARQLIEALLPYIREDGLFHDVVDDPGTFVETNLSQILCYTLCRGMRRGWLDSGYAGTASRLYRAALKKVDTYGVVWDVCGAPTFDRPGTAPEGQAFLLMMHHEYARYFGVRTD